MDTAAVQVGECPVGFCVRIRLAEVPVYEVALEGGGDGLALVDAWDRALGTANVEYAGKRSSGRLGPPVPVSVAPGGFARYRELRALAGAPEGQVKDPIVALDDETWTQVVSQ